MLNRKAFTLIELLVVIVIIGILTGIVVVLTIGAINSANDAKRRADLGQAVKSLLIYNTSNPSYPIGNCNIGSTCSPEIIAALGSSANAKDPETGKYYSYFSDGTKFTISTITSDNNSYSYDSSLNEYISSVPVAGTCGDANKTYAYDITSYGSDSFCSVGVASPSSPSFPSQGSSTNWTCAGLNGGAGTGCNALRGASPVAGVCGLANSHYRPSTPAGTDACSSGTVANSSGSGPYTWNCTGLNGGGDTSCSSVVASYSTEQFTTIGTSSKTIPVNPSTSTATIDYLIVGGGGGGGNGGNYGGGGGAGQFRTATGLSINSSLSIIVGAGGVAASAGESSSISSITTITSTGGAAGNASAGGTSGNGYAGGTPSGGVTNGGGGGSTGAGSNSNSFNGGNGGAGTTSSFSGTSVAYAGGGGGPAATGATAGSGAARGGNGGVGGGSNLNGGAAAANSGSGGGGAVNATGGAGGSGIVIIKYINNY